MKEERLVMQNPDLAERINEATPKKSDNPMAAMQSREFKPSQSKVLAVLRLVEGEGRGE